MGDRKRIIHVLIFLTVLVLTFYTLLRGSNLRDIAASLCQMSLPYLLLSVLLALFFVCAEGWMIWYLLKGVSRGRAGDGKGIVGLLRCVQYSFIGFFYSGITPSATGGQPVQLYYMSKDGNRASDSTVVLMTVAIVYKFVLSVIGAVLLIFWRGTLMRELGGFFPLYLLGLSLNIILVLFLLAVMLLPEMMLRGAQWGDALLIRLHVWKPSEGRREKVENFVKSYQDAVSWLKENKGRLLVIVAVTFLQRFSLFLLTYMVYRGFGLEGVGAKSVIFLQAAVYVAVDMLPLPGAQGISELMYKTVFLHVFPTRFMVPSMLVSRGINFYFLLIVSLGTVLLRKVADRRFAGGNMRTDRGRKVAERL